jgi:hypothetical protein
MASLSNNRAHKRARTLCATRLDELRFFVETDRARETQQANDSQRAHGFLGRQTMFV